MKKVFLIAGSLTLFFISCDNEEKAVVSYSSGNKVEELEIQAVIGDNVSTKTTIQNGTDIYWTQGDAINLFYGDSYSAQFTTSINSPTAITTFRGSITAVTGTNEVGMAAKPFWGVYPYNSLNTCDGSGVTLTIPSEQSGVAGTFASNLNPTVAKSLGLDLAFYNVGSWFKFTVSRSDITSLTFRGNSSENVAGKIRVEMDGNSRPVVTNVINGVTSITIAPSGGGCFTSGEEYYMVLIPQTLSDGYSLTLTTTDGSYATCVVEGSKEFERSKFRGKENPDEGLNFNIEFRDPLVKSICVANWDTNGDGELSYGEAAAVTSIPYGTFSGKTIQYFDEFQYFIGLTSSSALVHKEERDEGEFDYFGTFYNCYRLKSITLPSTLTTIGIACFRECTALDNITIPASVTTIKAIAFLGCPQLNVHMVSETPCTLTLDPRGTWSDPYVFGFINTRVNAITVPETAVDDYKSAQYWPVYRIQVMCESVDLGLSVKWAAFNVGATAPEEYGDYFAWGETEPYYEYGYAQEKPQAHLRAGKNNGYEWASYGWSNGTYNTLTRYCDDSNYGYNGFTDSKTVLNNYDDVANVKWGGSWRMPTMSECEELISNANCTWTWTTRNGISGYLVTSKKAGYEGRSIFLPAAGIYYGTSLGGIGREGLSDEGFYWTRTMGLHPYCGVDFSFNASHKNIDDMTERIFGCSVRPVCP